MFTNILSNVTNALTIQQALICTGASILLGIVIALCHYVTGKGNKNFLVTLVILPAMVQTVIMMVNGNLGTGVAIVGAFSLIRFRSIPGNSREISSIFFAMVVGLATGMGFITYAVFITAFVGAIMVLFYYLPIKSKDDDLQALKVTIYENLDYSSVFDDLFDEYLTECELITTKTTNMGSMYQLTYHIKMKDKSKQKEFIDALRCRNGNLTIICGRIIQREEQL